MVPICLGLHTLYLGGDKICPHLSRFRHIIYIIYGWQIFNNPRSPGSKKIGVWWYGAEILNLLLFLRKFFYKKLKFYFFGHKRLKTEAKQHHPWAIQERLFVGLLWMISSFVDRWYLALNETTMLSVSSRLHEWYGNNTRLLAILNSPEVLCMQINPRPPPPPPLPPTPLFRSWLHFAPY